MTPMQNGILLKQSMQLKDSLELFHDVIMIKADENEFQKLKNVKPDIVFNIAEGANGISREKRIPEIL